MELKHTIKAAQRSVKRAELAHYKMESECNHISGLLQPYFDGEISVLHQHSDGGFVVLYNTDVSAIANNSNLNDHISIVIENIESDINYYKNK